MIVFLLPCFSGGGAERVVINLLIGLHKRGHPVGIIVFNKTGPLLSAIHKDIPIYDLNRHSLKTSIVPFIKKIRQLNPDIIFSTFGYVNVSLLATSWLLPKKTKIWIREANLPSISLLNNIYPKVMKFLYWIFYRKAHMLICTSNRMKDEFVLDFFIPEKIIKIIPNPVDVDMIRELSTPVERYDKGGVCYVTSGRLVFQKGLDRLLRWFSEVKNKKSTLVILGSGDLKSYLENEAKLLNIDKRVKFVGFCKNPWKWYVGADIFLLSSRWEGMSNSVLESLACGTPVIATVESGGIKEVEESAPSGAILVAETDKQFIEYMNKKELHKKVNNYISLLPKEYYINSVLQTMENLINDKK